jgi:arylsulfatase A-like enzyme
VKKVWNSLSLGILLLAGFGPLVVGCQETQPRNNPSLTPAAIVAAAESLNFLVVVLDAAAPSHFGCYGYQRPTTPHIDALAAEAVLFEQAYAQASGTMLSVYSYFTSRYPIFGEELKIHPKMVLHIPADLTTMAEAMAERFHHRFGLTCNTWLKPEFGYAQGFTEFVQTWDLPELGTETTVEEGQVLPLTLAWLKEHADEGFFAYLHLMRPHLPYDPPEPFFSQFTGGKARKFRGKASFFRSMFDRRPPDPIIQEVVDLYDGNLAYADSIVGTLVASLKSSGIWERTVFVLMSDHGEAFWQHGTLAGHGGLVYEEAVLVPLLIRIPGVPALAGRRVTEPVELVDLLPTLLDLARVPTTQHGTAGISLVPLLAGTAVSGEPRFIHTRTNRRDPPIFAVRHQEYKVILWAGLDSLEIYNLQDDPGETHNLTPERGFSGPAPGETPPAELIDYLVQWSRGRSQAEVRGRTVPLDSLDEETRQRLRALGYVH